MQSNTTAVKVHGRYAHMYSYMHCRDSSSPPHCHRPAASWDPVQSNAVAALGVLSLTLPSERPGGWFIHLAHPQARFSAVSCWRDTSATRPLSGLKSRPMSLYWQILQQDTCRCSYLANTPPPAPHRTWTHRTKHRAAQHQHQHPRKHSTANLTANHERHPKSPISKAKQSKAKQNKTHGLRAKQACKQQPEQTPGPLASSLRFVPLSVALYSTVSSRLSPASSASYRRRCRHRRGFLHLDALLYGDCACSALYLLPGCNNHCPRCSIPDQSS